MLAAENKRENKFTYAAICCFIVFTVYLMKMCFRNNSARANKSVLRVVAYFVRQAQAGDMNHRPIEQSVKWISAKKKTYSKFVHCREFNVDSIKSGPENSFNKKTGKFEPFNRFRKKPLHKLNTDMDSLGRPVQKVALLCGPPGLGKTTLAHTIARHAGYSVLEINASDDRSPDAFKLALQNGTQMKSVLGNDKRPNCIVLGECRIDFFFESIEMLFFFA